MRERQHTSNPSRPNHHAVRTPWQVGFPDALILHRADEIQQHPDYRAAKAGDTHAAVRLLCNVVTDADCAKLNMMICNSVDVVVAVHAVEQSGLNKIPVIFAAYIAHRFGIKADTDIVQVCQVNRGGGDGVVRLARPVPFDGTVESGKRYLLVDDTLTQGGTLAGLKGYIEIHGGKVAGVAALMGKQYSARLALQAETLTNLRRYAGVKFEGWWNEAVGYPFDRLTESEARYLATLIRKSDADTVRNRIIAAG